MNIEYKEFVDFLKSKSLADYRNTLEDFYDLQMFESKFNFLNFLEFDYLPNKRLDIESENETYKKFNSGIVNMLYSTAIEKCNIVEKWVKEKRDYLTKLKIKEASKVDVLDAISFDLNFALNRIDEQIKQNDAHYYIISSNRELIDYNGLDIYLRQLTSVNDYLKSKFKDILIKANKVIDLVREVLPSIEAETNKKQIFHFIDFKGFGSISFSRNFKTFIINDLSYTNVFLNSEVNREAFIFEYDFKTMDINYFANRCNHIVHKVSIILNIHTKEAYDEFMGNTKSVESQLKKETPNKKRIPEKWYALLYWMQLISKCEQPPKTIEGEFIKSEIMTIGSKMTKTTGQSFYKKFIEIANYLNDEKMIEKMYSLDWKNKIIELSKNDADIITYFQVKPK